MANRRYEHRVTRDPRCCGGELRIAGTRVPLRVILASLREGDRPEDVVAAFPSITLEDVRAAVAFAEEALAEDSVQQAFLQNAS